MLSEHLQEVVDNGDLFRLFLANPQQKMIHRSIDFIKESPKHDMANNMFKIYLHDGFAKKEVVCLFPNHKTKKFLESKHFSNRDDFNIELNQRFSESHQETEQFGNRRFLILYGSHCFTCNGIEGTIYILWAKRIAKVNASNTPSIPYTDVPMIFNLNGLGKIKAIYLLRPQIENKPNELTLFPISQGNPVLLYNKNYNPFVCEERPDKLTRKTITIISEEDANVMVAQTTQDVGDWLPFERLPFSQVVDQGLVEVEHTNTYVPWNQSPRELFLSSSSLESGLLIRASSERAVGQLISTKTEPDPFLDTLDEEDELSSFSRGVEIELGDL